MLQYAYISRYIQNKCTQPVKKQLGENWEDAVSIINPPSNPDPAVSGVFGNSFQIYTNYASVQYPTYMPVKLCMYSIVI